jgi:hypothetical protein
MEQNFEQLKVDYLNHDFFWHNPFLLFLLLFAKHLYIEKQIHE